ncbi:DUF434 domain-containing protein [Acidianus sp. HS-5]|uniref:DUF434 domain-containing protein n=1 Tax=Acidianus sp. HS-5 TaxID=2886040 RepID=UPI001F3512FC|nr:DUF434 domain-containing protein [Acidianus sp. HS-5]BDC19811.1 hypothetical protein HS5_27010 [Acidianus sp. HS-5]
MILKKELKEAYIDYKYLLNRGYNRKPALDLVTGRYSLSFKQRLLLYRCTHSDEEIKEIKEKIQLEKNVIIDGFNVAITILNALDNDEAFICDDGFVRDLGLGSKKGDSRIEDILILFSEFCYFLGLSFTLILDSEISHSGEIASNLRKRGINANTVDKADKTVMSSESTIVSNDFVVMRNASKIFDLIGLFLQGYANLPRIPEDL